MMRMYTDGSYYVIASSQDEARTIAINAGGTTTEDVDDWGEIPGHQLLTLTDDYGSKHTRTVAKWCLDESPGLFTWTDG